MAEVQPNNTCEDLTDLEHDPYAHEHGVLLSNRIESYVHSHSMIQPFRKANLEPAGYQMRVGERYFRGLQREQLQDDSTLEIKPYEVVVMETVEHLRIPRFMIARWNIKVKLAYKGLLWVGAAQVDPGYVGKLSCPIYNLSRKPVILKKGDKLALIDFVKTTPYTVGDCKHFQSMPARGIEDVAGTEALESALSQYGERVEEVEERADEVEKTANDVRSQAAYFSTLFITLLGILFAVLVGSNSGVVKPIPEWSTWVLIIAIVLSLALSTSALMLVLRRTIWKWILLPVVLVLMPLLGTLPYLWGLLP